MGCAAEWGTVHVEPHEVADCDVLPAVGIVIGHGYGRVEAQVFFDGVPDPALSCLLDPDDRVEVILLPDRFRQVCKRATPRANFGALFQYVSKGRKRPNLF